MMNIRFSSPIAAFAISVTLLSNAAKADSTQYSRIVHDEIAQGTIEYFIEGKGGNSEKAHKKTEDGLFYSNHYLAVFDGATDKSGKKYAGRKGGRVARDIIYQVFETLPPALSPTQVIERINERYQLFYNKNKELDFEKNPLFRPTATLIWFDLNTNTLVSVGDSKARIDGEEYGKTDKLVDILNSELRSFTLKQLALSDEEIKNRDLGREYILPLLKKQSDFQNNPKAPEAFQFWAIDGFDIPENKLTIWKFDKKPALIELSTDGYMYPEEATIQSYEKLLVEVIEQDPLMKDTYKSTKGIQGKNVSFDDRAVLIFKRH